MMITASTVFSDQLKTFNKIRSRLYVKRFSTYGPTYNVVRCENIRPMCKINLETLTCPIPCGVIIWIIRTYNKNNSKLITMASLYSVDHQNHYGLPMKDIFPNSSAKLLLQVLRIYFTSHDCCKHGNVNTSTPQNVKNVQEPRLQGHDATRTESEFVQNSRFSSMIEGSYETR